MYGKIFDSIYDGTLRANWQGLVTFQQLIILADKDGVVDMTPHAIHGRTGIPLDIIEAGLEHLSKPDLYSRSPEEAGRRIVLIDESRPWGWRLVNHGYYNRLRSMEEKREADRERAATKRNTVNKGESRSVAESRISSRSVAEIAPIAVAVAVAVDTKPLCASGDALLHHFAEFWKAYPKKKNKGDAEKAWKKLKPTTDLANLLLQSIQTAKNSDDWRKENGQFIPYPASWLNAKGWEDDYDQKKSSSMFEGAM